MSETLHPISLGDLCDYWLREVPESQANAIEEHVFECARCAERLDAVVATGASLVALLRGGHLTGRATNALVNRFGRDRLNIRQYRVRSGETVPCLVTPSDDLVMMRLVLGELPAGRVDLSQRDESGAEVWRVEDATVDADLREVINFIPARSLLDQPSAYFRYVVLALEEGGERVLGSYTLDHTATHEA